MMTICKFRDKPFDVLIKLERRTLHQPIEPHNWSTNVRAEGGRSDPQLPKCHRQNEVRDPEKQFNKNIQSELTPFILDCLNSQQALFCKLPSHSYITVKIKISSRIELLIQIWYLLARKDSQTEGFSAN